MLPTPSRVSRPPAIAVREQIERALEVGDPTGLDLPGLSVDTVVHTAYRAWELDRALCHPLLIRYPAPTLWAALASGGLAGLDAPARTALAQLQAGPNGDPDELWRGSLAAHQVCSPWPLLRGEHPYPQGWVSLTAKPGARVSRWALVTLLRMHLAQDMPLLPQVAQALATWTHHPHHAPLRLEAQLAAAQTMHQRDAVSWPLPAAWRQAWARTGRWPALAAQERQTQLRQRPPSEARPRARA